MPNYRILNVLLSVVTATPAQYNCELTVCIDRQGPHTCQETNRYNIVIPDVDVVSKRITSRPNLLYYYWQKPSSAIELTSGNQMNCDNIKFYWIMDNYIRGKLILTYKTSSTMVATSINFVISMCDVIMHVCVCSNY